MLDDWYLSIVLERDVAQRFLIRYFNFASLEWFLVPFGLDIFKMFSKMLAICLQSVSIVLATCWQHVGKLLLAILRP